MESGTPMGAALGGHRSKDNGLFDGAGRRSGAFSRCDGAGSETGPGYTRGQTPSDRRATKADNPSVIPR